MPVELQPVISDYLTTGQRSLTNWPELVDEPRANKNLSPDEHAPMTFAGAHVKPLKELKTVNVTSCA